MRLFILTSLSALSLAHGVFAAQTQDPTYTKTNRPVYDSAGKCVRTQWQKEKDPCAPAAPVTHVFTPVQAPEPVTSATLPNIAREQRTVYFGFNKTSLDAEAKAKLDQLAEIINRSSAITDVSIHGFTDQLGTQSYNNALARKRAKAVKTYLDSKSRLKATTGDVRGLGKSTPDAACANVKKRLEKIACMGKERRVEIEFNAQE